MRVVRELSALICLTALSIPAFGQSAPNQELTAAQSTIARYCAAWGTLNKDERNVQISEVWAEGAEYMDSQPVHVTGREGLSAEIVKFQQQFPGAVFRCTDVRAHHGFVGYSWVMVMPDTSEPFKRMDFAS